MTPAVTVTQWAAGHADRHSRAEVARPDRRGRAASAASRPKLSDAGLTVSEKLGGGTTVRESGAVLVTPPPVALTGQWVGAGGRAAADRHAEGTDP